jgi:hypothetical protein
MMSASRVISDDDALDLVEKFLEVAGTLQDLGDTCENWSVRIGWLQALIGELWQGRGLISWCARNRKLLLQTCSLSERYRFSMKSLSLHPMERSIFPILPLPGREKHGIGNTLAAWIMMSTVITGKQSKLGMISSFRAALLQPGKQEH